MTLRHGGDIFAFARSRGWDWRDVADFSASINPLGPSPRVRPAIEAALDRIAHYPEPEPTVLRHALAAHWGADPDALLLGNGATDLIHVLSRTFRCNKTYLAVPVFSEFHRAFPQAEPIPFDSVAWPTDGLIAVTRPANPTGAMPDIDSYLRRTSNPVIADESFIEFTRCPSLLSAIGLRENLYVLRSLTKFYALPGLRIGALAGPKETITRWRNGSDPWCVNVLAEAATLASIGDAEHARRTIGFVESERAWLSERLAALPGFQPQPSAANFILTALDRPAAPIVEQLAAAKLLVRDCSGWPGVEFPYAIRTAVRNRSENIRLIEALGGSPCE